MIDNPSSLVIIASQMATSTQSLAVVSAAPSVQAGSVSSLIVNVLIAKHSPVGLILWATQEQRERE